MKGLVLWSEAQSTNLGVQALGVGTAALAHRVWPGIELQYQGWGAGDAPIRIGNPRRVAKQSVSSRSELLSWLSEFDVVLDTRAGDSFADIYGIDRLVAMSAISEAARRTKTPLILTPQTIGPFTTKRGRLIGRRCLSTARAVIARDAFSAGYANGLGRDVVALSTDVVFAIPTPAVQRSRDVVLNVSGLLWQTNTHVNFEDYRRTVRSLISGLVAAGRSVSLLAHVLDSAQRDNDVPAARELSEEYGGELEVLVPTSLTHVRELLASATLVIGSRMHACLNALSVGVPAIPMAYSRKFKPLLDQIGWDLTVDLRSSTDPAAEVLRYVSAPALGERALESRQRANVLLEVAHSTFQSAL